MRRFAAFFAIAGLAALEAIRRPVFLLASLSVFSGIVLLPLALNYTLGDSARIVRDSSLALYLVGGLLLGAHAAGDGLSRELRRGTASAVLSKPVSRSSFFLAKAVGVWIALSLYSATAFAAILLAVRAGAYDLHIDRAAAFPALLAPICAVACAGAWNHRSRRPFASAAFFCLLAFFFAALALSAAFPTPLDHVSFPGNFSWNVLSVGILLHLFLCMVSAFASALATRLNLSPLMLAVGAAFGLGVVADSFLAPRLADSPLARAAYALLPNVQAFWLVDALDSAAHIPASYFAAAAAYAVAWSAAALALGAASFRTLEIAR